MAIRKKSTIFAQFMVFTLVIFFVLYFLLWGFRDFLFQDLFGSSDQMTLVEIANLLVVYVSFYLMWDSILIIVFILMLNIIASRLLRVETLKIMIITLIALLGGFFIFHLIMYLWFWIGDPLGIKENGILGYILNLADAYSFNNDDTSNLISALVDYLIGYYYDTTFLEDPSLMNYFFMYLLMKGLVSDVPFQMNGIAFNPFRYDFIFIFIIYLIIFIPLFLKFINGCECVTEEEISLIEKQKREEVFGKKEEEGTVLGEYTRTIRTSKNVE